MGVISVDRDFVRFGQKSYATSKINSIEVREYQPHKHDSGLGFILFAGVAFLIGVSTGSSAGTITGGLVAAFLGWMAKLVRDRRKIVHYQLYLMTSSSETQAFVTDDANEVYELRDRIEAAMMARERIGRS